MFAAWRPRLWMAHTAKLHLGLPASGIWYFSATWVYALPPVHHAVSYFCALSVFFSLSGMLLLFLCGGSILPVHQDPAQVSSSIRPPLTLSMLLLWAPCKHPSRYSFLHSASISWTPLCAGCCDGWWRLTVSIPSQFQVVVETDKSPRNYPTVL